LNEEVKIITLQDLHNQRTEIEEFPKKVVDTILKSDITICIIDNEYISSVDKHQEIKTAIKKVQKSNNHYFFPIIYGESNWINTDWLLKAKLYPSNSSISEITSEEVDTTLNKLMSNLRAVLVRDIANRKSKPKINISKVGKIFISHSSTDSDFAELLQYKLKENGFDSWLDTDELKIGQDWRVEIDNGIQGSLGVIIILSPEASQSEYVTYEWAYASGLGKAILPILLRKTQIHPKLEILQYLDFTNIRARPYEELFSKIAKLK